MVYAKCKQERGGHLNVFLVFASLDAILMLHMHKYVHLHAQTTESYAA